MAHLMPFHAGYLMLLMIRRLKYNPYKMFASFLTCSDTVLDAGCAMGYFSIPLAKMVGGTGKVICADVQKEMLDVLAKRAKKRGLSDRIVIKHCTQKDLGIKQYDERINLAVIIHVIHETSHYEIFLHQIISSIKKDGFIYLAESCKETSEKDFNRYADYIVQNGFEIVMVPSIKNRRVAVFQKL